MKRKKPNAKWYCKILQDVNEWKKAMEQVDELNLKPHLDPPKNWDSLAAFDYIINNSDKDSIILDAGAEYYSVILNWLKKYGYRNIRGINLVFPEKSTKHRIRYDYGDITKTDYLPNSVDIVTCLSVVEHGVNLNLFLTEMSCIIKKGGALIVSFDYINKSDKVYKLMDLPWILFDKKRTSEFIKKASEYGFKLIEKLDSDFNEATVYNSECNIEYTFGILTFLKEG